MSPFPNRPGTPGLPDSSPATSPLLRPTSPTSSLLLSAAPSTLSPTTTSHRLRLRSRARSARLRRTTSLLAALVSALCAGSITVFSLYGATLQSRLRYSQFRVNGLASAASIAMYVPVPLAGYIYDRAGPAPLSLLAAVVSGVGYAAAAVGYEGAREVVASFPPPPLAGAAVEGGGYWKGWGEGGQEEEEEGTGWYVLMVFAFVAIGVGTCCMYMSAVATCAKNFGRGKHRGLAVVVPIAAFGLSGMLLSQVGCWLFASREAGAEEGEVDVFRFFVFLAVLLVAVGIAGAFGLKIVDENDIIEEAVEEMERSGLLDGSAIFTPGRSEADYGAIERGDPFDQLEDADTKDPVEEEARLKKQWLLNAETRRFLADHTMWCLALGFFLMVGPGEAFMNNMGTIIKTLYPPTLHYAGKPTSAATHVSIVGITSTAARLITGTLTDLLAPSPKARHLQITPATRGTLLGGGRLSVSRVTFLLTSAVLLSLGLAGLASGLVQDHGDRFWLVSGLVGAGYGAVFSLTPIIITVIWGVENFATNWGIVAMFPAMGATLWGLVYSAVYQAGARREAESGGGGGGGKNGGGGGQGGEEENLCYGQECYAPAFWAMAASVWIACGLVLWAWKGRNGWAQRGIVV
ncbi:MFS general substrate transporter [Parathielavia hyrcaniae]|uniref:Probable transporter MCH1 n=1 Tax=Parathielavia hyrcaniae TaxID=113614 RepID=A0AAN6Q2A6_9PEZI|nr:MFS general substrate transporter [Parathielavia hyrcaniae]